MLCLAKETWCGVKLAMSYEMLCGLLLEMGSIRRLIYT